MGSNLAACREAIGRTMREHPKTALPLGTLTPAGVLIPFFSKQGEAHILFLKRTLTVRHHKGQISFPGGARDAGDPDLRYTALRETEEEVGIRREDVEIIGELDDTMTPTNFRVTPFVGLIPYPYPFRINPDETAGLIEVPVAHLLDPANHRLGFRRFHDRIYEVHYYSYDRHTIWGVTGFILRGLLRMVGG